MTEKNARTFLEDMIFIEERRLNLLDEAETRGVDFRALCLINIALWEYALDSAIRQDVTSESAAVAKQKALESIKSLIKFIKNRELVA